MKKTKLFEARKAKDYTQMNVADELEIHDTTYSRKERWIIKISEPQWNKIAEILGVKKEDIYEPDTSENPLSIYGDNAAVNYQGSNNTIHAVPEFLLETQQAYFKKIKADLKKYKTENQRLKEKIKNMEEQLKK